MDRVIYHIDCNGFYAAVECLDQPHLRSVPMAVAGDPQYRSGIILAKNELAKAYGVTTTETIQQARRKCADLVLVPPRHERYSEISHQIRELFAQYTDQVEPFGSDEAWLDVTGSLQYFHATPLSLADIIRNRVREEIGITVSVGVSFNKIFAKIGSDMKKPDATTLISHENYQQLVWPLPAEALLFVGRASAQQLQKHGIKTIGDVARSNPDFLRRLLGKGGDILWLYANGMDTSRVKRIGEEEQPKSVGNGMTFQHDLVGWDELRRAAVTLSDEVAMRLHKAGMVCGAVQISIKTPQLRLITRQAQMSTPSHLHKEIADASMQLLYHCWNERSPVRALTITALHLMRQEEAFEQADLFSEGDAQQSMKRQKFEQLENTVLQIRAKHGGRSIAIGQVRECQKGREVEKENFLKNAIDTNADCGYNIFCCEQHNV